MPELELYLIGLKCEKTTRGEAKDEAYLRASKIDRNGRTVVTNYGTIWSHQMDEGDARSIRWRRRFNQSIQIELWEHDRNNHDEHIQNLQIQADEPTENYPYRRNPYALTGHGATYWLHYELRNVEEQRPDNYVLTLLNLRCNDAQEREDEPYITVDGVTRWGPGKMKTGDTATINRDVTFRGTAQVELWERDPNLSDRFGRPFRVSQIPESNNHITFASDRGIVGDASYTLTYSVRRAR